jgi:hypothetical protein
VAEDPEQVLPQQRVGTCRNVEELRVKTALSATVITGTAKSRRNCTTVIIHEKIGIFMSVMPGARMLSTVTIRLMAPVSEAMPAICRPSAQKSTP